MVAKVLEAIMIILFGISWPFNLFKSIKTRSAKGKSILFLVLIDLGYIAGITSKFFSETFVWSTDWWIFMIYCINLSFVSADLVMYFVNMSKDRRIETEQIKTVDQAIFEAETEVSNGGESIPLESAKSQLDKKYFK